MLYNYHWEFEQEKSSYNKSHCAKYSQIQLGSRTPLTHPDWQFVREAKEPIRESVCMCVCCGVKNFSSLSENMAKVELYGL